MGRFKCLLIRQFIQRERCRIINWFSCKFDQSTLIAGRYRVVALIGKGSFSRVVQCYDHQAGRSVSVKVLHNDKDCIDQGIGEIRLLSLIAKRDPNGEVRSYITA